GEEKVQKIAAGEEGNYRMERVPLKQTDRHHKSPGGDLCIRDSEPEGSRHSAINPSVCQTALFYVAKTL
ncbi:hypothetical protein OYO91_12865, partial [Escherichia coli]|nr:hypothetical protein [Escherichia coli]